MMLLNTLTIVGVGLIGGSIGLAARKRGLAQHIVGVGRDVARLHEALERGAIDEGTADLAEACSRSDLLIFCTPVNRIAQQVLQVLANCGPGTIVTDAGSVKAAIVAEIEKSPLSSAHFVGGHPLAGSEKKGVAYANADLFVDRVTVLTPTERTNLMAVQTVRAFWQALGSRVHQMTPSEHDEALAMTSHLPHLVASALAGVLDPRWHALAATGFRDTTRIAAGDPEVWTPIFEQNRAAVLASLTVLEERLRQFRAALTDSQSAHIDSLLFYGKKVRDALGS